MAKTNTFETMKSNQLYQSHYTTSRACKRRSLHTRKCLLFKKRVFFRGSKLHR